MSENVKHTPGPWVCYADLPSTEPNWHIVTTANKKRVIANVHIEPGNAMDEANACLIAAAPDLLKALKALSASIFVPGADKSPELSTAIKMTIDAIAKAEAT